MNEELCFPKGEAFFVEERMDDLQDESGEVSPYMVLRIVYYILQNVC